MNFLSGVMGFWRDFQQLPRSLGTALRFLTFSITTLYAQINEHVIDATYIKCMHINTVYMCTETFIQAL